MQPLSWFLSSIHLLESGIVLSAVAGFHTGFLAGGGKSQGAPPLYETLSGDDGERCDWLNATLSNVQAQVLEYPDNHELNAAIELVLKQYTPTCGWCYCSFCSDDDGERCEALKPKLTCNPIIQRTFQVSCAG